MSIEIIKQKIRSNKSSIMNLAGCGIDTSHLLIISKCLMANKNISSLNLRHNSIKDEGLLILQDILLKNKNIIKVNIKSNFIKDGSSELLLKLIDKACLTELLITYNSISKINQDKIRKRLEINCRIRSRRTS